jgi:hypothetical protein
MIKKIISLTLVLLPFLTQAQVTINAQLPPAGLVQKDQLWNLIVVNNKADILDVSIKMNLQDAQTGQVVLSASSGNILLSKGVKILTARDIQPVLYNYNVQDLSRNFLPMGNYVACYRLINNIGEKQEVLGEDCININIDPLSPPLLNTPTDKADIQTEYPQFSWMPPSPFDMFSNLSYDLLVTELLPNQTAIDAIQYNTAVYSKTNITQPYENYSSSFAKLEAGKTYAWQVIAKNGVSYAAKTEVWTFKITNEKPETKVTSMVYITLGTMSNESGMYNLKGDNLNIKYYAYEEENQASIKIKKMNGEVMQELKQKIQYGDNFFNVKLNKNINKETQYLIELVTVDGKVYSSLFSINNK